MITNRMPAPTRRRSTGGLTGYAHPGQPCRCPANPITRCRRHSLVT